jgi:peptidoglycan/LPS O-acetylase OafA/YrhL
MPSENARYQFIDSLRGIAILSVIAYHSLGPSFGFYDLKWGEGLGRDFNVRLQFLIVLPASLGWAGVAVFFAISGFCIHNSFAKERAFGFSRYLVKRVCRIYPPYILALLVFYIYQMRVETKWGDLLSHLLLIHNYFPSYRFGINPAFWSIAVEFQLYIVYMALFLLIDKYGWPPVLTACLVIEFCIRLSIGYGIIPAFLSETPLNYLFSWLIGAGAAELCRRGSAAKVRVTGLLVTILMASAVASCFVKPFGPFCFMFFAIATTALMLYMHQRAVGVHVPYLAVFGVVSYSVYLIHQPILDKIGSFFGHSVPVLTFVVCLLGVFPLYWISRLMWKHVEISSINLGNKVLLKLKYSQCPMDKRELVSYPLLVDEGTSKQNGTLAPVRPEI